MILEGLAKAAADGVKKATAEVGQTSIDKVASNQEKLSDFDDVGESNDTNELENDSYLDGIEVDDIKFDEPEMRPEKNSDLDVDKYIEEMGDDNSVIDNIENGDELVNRLNDGATDGIFDGVRDNVKQGVIDVLNKGVDVAVDVTKHGMEKIGEVTKAYIDYKVNEQFEITANEEDTD